MDTESDVKWSSYSTGYFENPYLHLKDCRKNNPVQEVYKDTYFFFRYEDVNSILKEKDFKVHSLNEYLGEKEAYIFKNVENACPYLKSATQFWPMYLNYEIHRKIRKAITKAFHILPLEKLIIESYGETLNIYKSQIEFDLVDFCGSFIYFFVKKALNIDSEDYVRIKDFSNLVARSQDLNIPRQIYQEINAEIVALKHIFKDSIFKDTIIEETKDINLEQDELYSIMLVSFMAAFETSKDNLSLGLYEILKKPDLIDSIEKTNQKGLKIAIEEIFRFTSPLQYTVRINTKPLTFGSLEIKENSKLYLCLASANRDEEVFEQANELILDREENPHLAFGTGSHLCLGATIARQEMELCFKSMVDFLKDFEVGDITWSKQILMRTAKSLTLTKKDKHV